MLEEIKSILAFPYYKLAGYRPTRVPVAAWDERFRSGKYSYLEDLSQIGGLSMIFGYCQFLDPKSILDVGCGYGSLTKNIRALDYKYYLGIDISAEAVSQAQASYSDDRTDFAVADATQFVPHQKFDVIIFNQCAYYFDNPQDVVQRYAEFLTPSGRIIVSMTDCGKTRAAWPLISRNMIIENSITIAQHPGRNITKLLAAKR
jgi:SAM-dependent methyltransferase